MNPWNPNQSLKPPSGDVLVARTIAHDEGGNLSIVEVNGRIFVHGSILDEECAKRDKELDGWRMGHIRSGVHPICDVCQDKIKDGIADFTNKSAS